MSSPDERFMQRALQLARLGEGFVEPNPMVGCVVVEGGEIVAEGYHARFGGPHAERAAAETLDLGRMRESTWYVTLEPCCHHGKTPPCTELLIAAHPSRVVIATRDPFPKVDGGGVAQLRGAGIQVDVGVGQREAEQLNAPYFKRLRTGQPWVIAKWAMTLDGRIATVSGHSQWISGEESRREVHRLRSKVDAVIVGRGTLLADDPLLTPRHGGPRVPRRVVLSSCGEIAEESRLIQSMSHGPVLVVCGPATTSRQMERLSRWGCEVFQCTTSDAVAQVRQLLDHLGTLNATNVLVEGGAAVHSSFLAADAIDEFQVYIAPKIVGGASAPGPVGGLGLGQLSDSPALEPLHVRQLGGDLLVTTRRIRG